MTATEELRRMLDERGVEWHHTSGSLGIPYTWWYSPTMGEVDATEGADGKLYMVLNLDLTPAQAVEATLGKGTCHDLAETPNYRDKTEFRCSACGYEYSAVGGFGCDCGDEPDFRYCPNCGRKVVDE